jgi:hypothetical protein
MLDSGRARTFTQRLAPDVPMAISSCPVDCMHKVSLHELKEMEVARDQGDGRTDHRHLGNRRGHTPLSVAGIDSDANHRSSWYHYLKQKCASTSLSVVVLEATGLSSDPHVSFSFSVVGMSQTRLLRLSKLCAWGKPVFQSIKQGGRTSASQTTERKR